MWNKKLENRINEVIEKYKNSGNYVVFDCDNTILMNDIQFALIHYLLKFKKFKVTPIELKKFLNNKFPQETEIINNFCNIFKNAYYEDINSMEYLKFLSNFSEFVEYLYFKYDKFDLNIFFSYKNMSYEELQKLIDESIKYHNNSEFGIENWIYEDNISTYKLGLKITDEMSELIKKLHDNNIDVYVISASTLEVVEAVLKPLKKYISKIYAKKITNTNNIFTGLLDENELRITSLDKKIIIENILKKKYNKDPIIVAGDSMGDFDMLTEFENTEISILIDRNRIDNFTNLLNISDNRYIKQCVDENLGIFISEEKSLTL